MRTEPCAYFITFRTYATWLHGDTRFSVDRLHNIYSASKIKPNENLMKCMQEKQKHNQIILTKKHGDIILNSALYACNKYDWRLYAMHVRTNHVHLTVKSSRTPEHVSTQIKAYATRFLRDNKEFHKDQKIWSRGSSTKYLWTPESLYFVNEYVVERQGQRMAYLYGEI